MHNEILQNIKCTRGVKINETVKGIKSPLENHSQQYFTFTNQKFLTDQLSSADILLVLTPS